jgi:hypothetical protein
MQHTRFLPAKQEKEAPAKSGRGFYGTPPSTGVIIDDWHLRSTVCQATANPKSTVKNPKQLSQNRTLTCPCERSEAISHARD